MAVNTSLDRVFLDLLVSFLVVTFLLALIFKLLPDVTVSWKDVWIGAIFTAVLFLIGKCLIGVYTERASVGSVYGAAGSLVVVLCGPTTLQKFSSLVLN